MDLPEYQSPPLNEVVLGVQFDQPEGYQQIHAGEVWSLYKSEYPQVQEQIALEPAFETFGLPQAAQFNLGLIAGASHDRFWFLSPAGDELIQFQNDRLLHNWRKVGNEANEYPRFEMIVGKFENELRRLEDYMRSLGSKPGQRLRINQSEITYINHIVCGGEPGTVLEASKWLSLVNVDQFAFEDFNSTFRRRVLRSDGTPYARLICQAATGYKPKAGRMIVLSLTFRGAPQGDTAEAALDFLGVGHQMIVEFFTQITTESAHRVWGRTR